MQREFEQVKWGSKYRAVVTIGDVLGRKMLEGVLNGNTGWGRFSRRMKSVFIEGDNLARVEAGLRRDDAMPGWALADVLEEVAGWDSGFTDVLRESETVTVER